MPAENVRSVRVHFKWGDTRIFSRKTRRWECPAPFSRRETGGKEDAFARQIKRVACKMAFAISSMGRWVTSMV